MAHYVFIYESSEEQESYLVEARNRKEAVGFFIINRSIRFGVSQNEVRADIRQGNITILKPKPLPPMRTVSYRLPPATR